MLVVVTKMNLMIRKKKNKARWILRNRLLPMMGQISNVNNGVDLFLPRLITVRCTHRRRAF